MVKSYPFKPWCSGMMMCSIQGYNPSIVKGLFKWSSTLKNLIFLVSSLSSNTKYRREKNCFKNGPTPASFSYILGLFKQTSLKFLQQINVKKCHVHPVYGVGIRTHDLLNMCCLPLPLEQGSRPKKIICDDLFPVIKTV